LEWVIPAPKMLPHVGIGEFLRTKALMSKNRMRDGPSISLIWSDMLEHPSGLLAMWIGVNR